MIYSRRLAIVYVKSSDGDGAWQRLPECSEPEAAGASDPYALHFSVLADVPTNGFAADDDVLRAALRGLTPPCDLQVDVYEFHDGAFQIGYSEYLKRVALSVQQCSFLTPQLVAVDLTGSCGVYYLVPMPRDMLRYPLGG